MSRTVLVCLPFAGGGATFFKKWQPEAPPGLDIVAVQPPGREERYVDDPFTTVEAVVGEAYDWLLPQLAGAGRVALFGHSLGAVLAYELAHRLAAATSVTRLFVSGSAGPWQPRRQRATGLPDDAFVQAVRRFAGYTHPAMDDPEMREILLPSLRADVEMHESYVAPRDRPLPVPITALRGRDDELISAEQCAEWTGATTAGFDLIERDGEHMYLTTGAAGLLRRLGERLAESRPSAPGATATPAGR
jgi:surfactin synthase thioesterase subunit